MKNVRSKLKIELVKKDDDSKLVKVQSELTFEAFHKSYDKYGTYTSKQKDIMREKPINLGFVVLHLSQLVTFETRYDKIQTYFRRREYTIETFGH